ncbi:T9SS type A sorting domain-containing protein [Hymenobacter aranciens]|nr:T9SS type A sorting domain-containing protein [Hymenobacter sp. ASUV-10]
MITVSGWQVAGWVLALWLPASLATAQGPVLTTLFPRINAASAPAAGGLTLAFTQALTPASAAGLHVFSAKRGGLRTRTAPAVVSGNELRYTLGTTPFVAGETVQYTATTAVTGPGGPLTRPVVGQFTVGTRPSAATFALGPTVSWTAPDELLALADVNGDGLMDMLVSSFTVDTVSVHLGVGGGQFRHGSAVTTDFDNNRLRLADMDGDGDLDLLVGKKYTYGLHLCRNDGTGRFAPAQPTALNSVVQSLEVGDVDGDGDLDVLIPWYQPPQPGLLLGRNDGTGALTPELVVAASDDFRGLVLGDLDGDHDLDVVATSYQDSTVRVYRNDGRGAFTPTAPLAMGRYPDIIKLADFNNDGALDLLCTHSQVPANPGFVAVSVGHNNGTGTFSRTLLPPMGTVSQAVADVGDVDGDGDLDLLLTGTTDTNLRLALNPGNGQFATAQVFNRPSQSYNAQLVDADSDGDLDVVVSIPSTTTAAQVLLNDGTALAAAPAATSAFTVYPNPAAGRATLRGAPPHTPVLLLDALGRCVWQGRTTAAGTAIMALPASLAPGLYLLRLTTGGTTATQRLVVE